MGGFIDAVNKLLNGSVPSGEGVVAPAIGKHLTAGAVVGRPATTLNIEDYVSGGYNRLGNTVGAKVHQLLYGSPSGIPMQANGQPATVGEAMKGLPLDVRERMTNLMVAMYMKEHSGTVLATQDDYSRFADIMKQKSLADFRYRVQRYDNDVNFYCREAVQNEEQRFRKYPDEPLNARINNPRIRNVDENSGSLYMTVDGKEYAFDVTGNTYKGWENGSLPLNTLANAVLRQLDMKQARIDSGMSQALDNERSQGVRQGLGM